MDIQNLLSKFEDTAFYSRFSLQFHENLTLARGADPSFWSAISPAPKVESTPSSELDFRLTLQRRSSGEYL